MAFSAGMRLGPYEVVAPLGAGGMGEVYRARDTKLGREVAIKILPDALALDPDRVARLEREAKALAALNHPYIAVLFGLDESAGRHFLVMELVEGETLAERIERGALPVEEALRCARQIAEALEAAHEKGIVHRDLKPANVKITPDEKVKVLDFGLAKADSSASGRPGSPGAGALTHSPTLSMMATEAGMILGTAAYMSPEQAKGFSADGRSDIFSFGVVLYEMLSGRQPFHGETAPEILASVLIRDADLNRLPSDLNPRLIDLLKRCLQKNPKQRWQHIGDVCAELETIAADPRGASAIAGPVTVPVWKRVTALTAAAVVGGGLASAIVWRFRPAARATVVRFTVPLPEGQDFTNAGRLVVAISPDGTRVVYVANQRLYGRAMWDAEARPIAGTDLGGAVLNPVFSPDGEMVAFWSSPDATIRRVAFVGGAAVTVAKTGAPAGMSWDRDGILVGQGDRIIRVSSKGGNPEALVSARDGELLSAPQRLPEGNRVLFTVVTRDAAARGDRFENSQVVVHSLTDGQRTVVVEAGSDGRYLLSGHLVYAVGGVLFAAPFNPRAPKPVTSGIPIVQGIRRANTAGQLQFSVSADGSFVYLSGSPTGSSSQLDLALLDLKGGAIPLGLQPAAFRYPRLSPDGSRVAVDTDTGTQANVWIYDLSGKTAIRRLTLVGHNRFPVWSPDGQYVAFQSDREGDLGMFRQRADGTGVTERLTKTERGFANVPRSWSPDGRHLLYESLRELSSTSVRYEAALMVLNVADRRSTSFGDVTSDFTTDANFSPDGHWVAYSVSARATGTRTFVQPFPATGDRYEVGVGRNPVWSSDGKTLYLSQGPGQFRSMSITTKPSFATGPPVPVRRASVDSEIGSSRPFDIAGDGKVIGLVEAGASATASAASTSQLHVVLNWIEELKQRVPLK